MKVRTHTVDGMVRGHRTRNHFVYSLKRAYGSFFIRRKMRICFRKLLYHNRVMCERNKQHTIIIKDERREML